MYLVLISLDAKQLWEIKAEKELVTKPAEFKPSWIKEPTFPDEVMYVQMGHTIISKVGEVFFIIISIIIQ